MSMSAIILKLSELFNRGSVPDVPDVAGQLNLADALLRRTDGSLAVLEQDESLG